MEIRTLRVEDAEQFVALRRLALQTDPTAFPWNAEDDPNSKIEVVRERLLLAKPSDGPFVVGAFDSDLIGVMGLIRVSEDTVRLWGVYVQPDSCAKGIGRILLQQSLQLARGLPGVKKVILSVARTEEPALRLYTGQGFRTSNEDQGSLDMVLELDKDSGPSTE